MGLAVVFEHPDYLAENDSPHVHFWGAIARVVLEQFGDKSLILPGTLGQHFGNDAPEILISFEVVSILRKSNAVLRNGLEAFAPFEPSSVCGRGHQTWILRFLKTARNKSTGSLTFLPLISA